MDSPIKPEKCGKPINKKCGKLLVLPCKKSCFTNIDEKIYLRAQKKFGLHNM